MPNNNNLIDLGKFKSFHDQLANIQLVVDKLVTKQNASVYNKIGTKIEVLFNAIDAIDMKSAPVEEIRNLIDLLKKLRETCITLSSYKQYLMSVLPQTVDKLEGATQTQTSEVDVTPQVQEVNPNLLSAKTLELTNNEGIAA